MKRLADLARRFLAADQAQGAGISVRPVPGYRVAVLDRDRQCWVLA